MTKVKKFGLKKDQIKWRHKKTGKAEKKKKAQQRVKKPVVRKKTRREKGDAKRT